MKENFIGAVIAALGTVASAFFGGWDIALQILVFCMIADYATGLLGAIKTKSVNSEVMFWGGIGKGIVFVVIALAVMLDKMTGSDAPVFRTLALYFYIGREGLSIIENLGILNVPLPAFLKKVLAQLQEKGDGKDANHPEG